MQRSTRRGFKLKRTFSDISFNNIRKNEFELQNGCNRVHVPNEPSDNMRCKRSKSSHALATYTCDCGKPQNIPNESVIRDMQIPTEKSTIILVAIVVLFIITHSFRLSLKMYEVLIPHGNTLESFERCLSVGR